MTQQNSSKWLPKPQYITLISYLITAGALWCSQVALGFFSMNEVASSVTMYQRYLPSSALSAGTKCGQTCFDLPTVKCRMFWCVSMLRWKPQPTIGRSWHRWEANILTGEVKPIVRSPSPSAAADQRSKCKQHLQFVDCWFYGSQRTAVHRSVFSRCVCCRSRMSLLSTDKIFRLFAAPRTELILPFITLLTMPIYLPCYCWC